MKHFNIEGLSLMPFDAIGVPESLVRIFRRYKKKNIKFQ